MARGRGGTVRHRGGSATGRVWNAFVRRSGLPPSTYPFARVAGAGAPSLGPSAVYGLPLRFFGLEFARWCNFAIGAFGLFALFALLRRRFSSGASTSPAVAAGTLAIVAFSIPFTEYVRLIYPETLLFSTIAFALYALAANRRMAVVIAAGLMPFEHARGLPISLAFASLVLWDTLRENGARRSVAREGLTYVAMLGVWALVDIRLYGSVTGLAFSTGAPSFASFFARFGAQLYDVRHGLLIYSPIFLLAFAGLAAGTIGRDRGSQRALLLFAAYLFTFVWSAAGESWAGRFWVAALPMLAVGLAYWLAFARSLVSRIVFTVLLALTAANAALFSLHPGWLLYDRSTSLTYEAIGSFLHLSIASSILPLDNDGNPLRATVLFAATAVAVLALIAIDASTSRAAAAGGRARGRAPRSARGARSRKR